MKKTVTLFALLCLVHTASAQFVVEWDKIVHWAGEGPDRSALLVQFNDGGEQKCYVWGYRWDSSRGETSGEDMIRAVAAECSDLTLFTQYTGWMGNTVCGIGYSKDNAITVEITYNFEGAEADDNISFDYWTPNTSMGQTEAPGADTQEICDNALMLAHDTHIIDHPINALNYGYAAYDYDWWQPADSLADGMRWQAGWYKGYWSYWVGGVDPKSLSYSGLGMTSRKLSKDCVDAWCYNYIDGEYIDGVTGATAPSYPLDYNHFSPASLEAPGADAICVDEGVYNLNGIKIAESTQNLSPGIYIIRKNDNIRKLIIK